MLVEFSRIKQLAALALIFFGSVSAPAETFTDVLGNQLVWEAPPKRIVSLSPSLTEILFAIGNPSDHLVGITRYCNYPAETASIRQVGGIVDPSLEAILLTKPDLVLMTRGNPLEFMESLRQLDLAIYSIEANGDLALIIDVVREVGRVSGLDVGAGKLAEALERRLARVTELTATIPAGERPRVYFGDLDGAHWSPGPGSYIQALLEAAGCENIGAIAEAPWSPLSLEVIIEQDPQVLIGTFSGDAAGEAAAARARAIRFIEGHEAWSQTSLGRAPRVIMIHADRILRPGPRVFDVLEEITRFIHPGLLENELKKGMSYN